MDIFQFTMEKNNIDNITAGKKIIDRIKYLLCSLADVKNIDADSWVNLALPSSVSQERFISYKLHYQCIHLLLQKYNNKQSIPTYVLDMIRSLHKHLVTYSLTTENMTYETFVEIFKYNQIVTLSSGYGGLHSEFLMTAINLIADNTPPFELSYSINIPHLHSTLTSSVWQGINKDDIGKINGNVSRAFNEIVALEHLKTLLPADKTFTLIELKIEEAYKVIHRTGDVNLMTKVYKSQIDKVYNAVNKVLNNCKVTQND